MRKAIFVKLALLLLPALTLGAGCPLIPDIEEKVVELSVGGSVITEFEADGIINTYNETETVDFGSTLDLVQILEDAGVDADSVKAVSLTGVSYRVTVPDPNPGRAIENATVTIRRGSGPETPLLTNFASDVNSVTAFTTAPLDPAGVALLNDLLADLLADVQAGGTSTSIEVTYHVEGDCTPAGAETSFTWQMKVDVTILGTIKVEVPS
jgi:hypothetical protein